MKKFYVLLMMALAGLASGRVFGAGTPLRNICRIKGQEENVLQGMGLVVGLSGTGEAADPATMRALARAMDIMGVPVPELPVAQGGGPQRGAGQGQQGEACLVVDRHAVHGARPAVHPRALHERGAQHEVVRGQHAVGADGDAHPDALLAQDRGRGVPRGDVGAQEDDRWYGGARDGDRGIHVLGLSDRARPAGKASRATWPGR